MDEVVYDHIPSPEHFMLYAPLYRPIKFNPKGPSNVPIYRIENYSGRVDTYCPKCKTTSTFVHFQTDSDKHEAPRSGEHGLSSLTRAKGRITNTGGDIIWRFYCARQPAHLLEVWAVIRPLEKSEGPDGFNMALTKVGQFPSLPDLYTGNILKYKGLLKDQYAELNRAIGLHSHDIGVGSFVYLRRIFESIVEESHQLALKTHGWDDGNYIKIRWDERIQEIEKALPGSLPGFLVQNRSLFSILSKHLHELTEDEAMSHFEIVEQGIESILNQRLAELERQKNEKKAKDAIDKLARKVKT